MPIRARCPNPECRREAQVPDAVVGKPARCRGCGTAFVVRPADEPADGAAEVSLSMLKGEPPPAADTTPAAPPPAPAVAPGGTVGRFEVRRKLGAGAFGTVYLAHDPQLQRDVAVKVPKAAVLGSPQRVERFLREARAAARLRHPNVVPVYDAGRDGATLYIASAFVAGEPLSEVVADGGIDPKRAATLVRALAEGLGYAHQLGVVHRDVKPANVMVDDLGQPLLMDFGLAAQVDATEDFRLPDQEADAAAAHDSARLTRAGAVMGTPAYMAPEAAGGLYGEAKPAADQYALGVVLYELLTGRLPFDGPADVVLHHAAHTAPPPPRQLRTDVPPDLEAVCLRAMAKDPRDRYVSCYALADDLRRWLDGEPVRARRAGVAERTRRWVRTEPRLALAAGAAAAALLAAAGVAATTVSAAARTERDAAAADRDAARKAADEARGLLDAGRVELDRARDDGRAAGLDAVRSALAAGNPLGAADRLDRVPPDRRDLVWRLLAAQAAGYPEFRRVLPAPPAAGLAFRADGRHLVQVTPGGERIVWDLLTGREVRRTPVRRPGDEAAYHLVAVAADARRVATFAPPPAVAPKGPPAPARPLEVVVWDEDGKVVRAIPVAVAPLRLALSPDGALVAAAGGPADGEQRLTVWTADTGERVAALEKTLSAVPGPGVALAFSPDGKLLAATTIREGGEVRAWDTATGEEKLVLKDRTAVVTHLAFSPDGTRLAAAGGGDRLDGPELTATVCKYVPETYTVTVDRDGTPAQESRTRMKCVEEQVKSRGYRNPRTKVVTREVCETVQMEKTVYVTRYVTREVGGKTVQVPEPVPTTSTYTVTVTKPVTEVVAAADPVVRVWRVDGGAPVAELADAGDVAALLWPADGTYLLTVAGRADGCAAAGCGGCGSPGADRADVSLWDAATGRRLITLPAPAAGAVALSPDLKHLAVGAAGFPAGVTTWGTESYWLLANGRGDGPVTGLAFAPDGKRLASRSACDGVVRLWDVPGGGPTARLAGVGPLLRFLTPDRFVADNLGSPYSPGGSLGRWLAAGGAPEDHPGKATDVHAYSADGTRLVAGRTAFGEPLRVLDGASGQAVVTLAESAGVGPRKLQASRDGTRVAALAGNEAVLWDGVTGRVLARRAGAVEAELSADGSRWAVAVVPVARPGAKADPAPKATGPAVILSDGAGEELARFPEPSPFGVTLTFGPDARRLVGASKAGVVKVWDADEPRLLAQYRTAGAPPAVSPDGRFLAVRRHHPAFAPAPAAGATDPEPPLEPALPAPEPGPCGQLTTWVTLLDLGTGRVVWAANVTGTGFGGLAFSADGKRLAMGFADGAAGFVQIWETAAPPAGPGVPFVRAARYAGHVGAVPVVAFSPDGAVLASGGDDRRVKLWRLPADGEDGPGADRPAAVSPGVPAPLPPSPGAAPPPPM